ncbi:unnamed protein product [Pleuronectes platessa]|uniref:Uncharacterized protein n=1 Tax=Pleuronectes platessa TaxID=8262 RepID=A0A9N7TWT3_PLEPL|nr:unnamed protein product [Pleuronectes platessa]
MKKRREEVEEKGNSYTEKMLCLNTVAGCLPQTAKLSKIMTQTDRGGDSNGAGMAPLCAVRCGMNTRIAPTTTAHPVNEIDGGVDRNIQIYQALTDAPNIGPALTHTPLTHLRFSSLPPALPAPLAVPRICNAPQPLNSTTCRYLHGPLRSHPGQCTSSCFASNQILASGPGVPWTTSPIKWKFAYLKNLQSHRFTFCMLNVGAYLERVRSSPRTRSLPMRLVLPAHRQLLNSSADSITREAYFVTIFSHHLSLRSNITHR